jgi:hypothetical protein
MTVEALTINMLDRQSFQRPHNPGPYKSIGRGELRPLYGAMKNTELMAERKNFKLQSCAAPQGRANKRIIGQ